MSTSSNVPTDITIRKPSKSVKETAYSKPDGPRIAFGDVTNRTKANDSSKNGKPAAFKRSGTTSTYFGKDEGKSRKPQITRKRLADLPLDDAVKDIKDVEEAVEKRFALKSLKDSASDVSEAIEAEGKAKSYALVAKKSVDPFQNITQSPKPEALDVEPAAAPVKYETLDLDAPIPTTIAHKVTSYQYSTDAHDIDKRDEDDPLCVTEHIKDMVNYWRDEEHRTRIEPDYMLFQKEISPKMRAILVDWLALVCTKSKLQPEVLYLTVNLLDRYLSLKKTTKRELQLVGMAALFIASKYEEIYCIPVDDLIYLCDRAYTVDQVYEMEIKMLRALNYQISLPTTWKFLLRFLNAGHCDKKMVYMSQYVLESTMLNIDFIDYMPSELAAAAVMIARKAAKRNAWSPTLRVFAGYVEEEILPVAREMVNAIERVPSDLTATKKKYSTERKFKVAEMPLPKF